MVFPRVIDLLLATIHVYIEFRLGYYLEINSIEKEKSPTTHHMQTNLLKTPYITFYTCHYCCTEVGVESFGDAPLLHPIPPDGDSCDGYGH
jgi:hypothetical protein